jgi:hypothetical protein
MFWFLMSLVNLGYAVPFKMPKSTERTGDLCMPDWANLKLIFMKYSW